MSVPLITGNTSIDSTAGHQAPVVYALPGADWPETDWKTHLIALSYFLIGLGIVLAGASFYIATIVHPMVAMASPTALVTAGCFLRVLQLSPESAQVSTPRPLGLHNMGANCFLNASFQLIAFKLYPILEDVQKRFHNNERTAIDITRYLTLLPLIQLVSKYRNEVLSGNRSLSNVETQDLRLWLHNTGVDIPSSPFAQWDAIVLLEALFDRSGVRLPTLEKKTTIFSDGSPKKGEPVNAPFIYFSFENVGERNFNTLWEGNFEEHSVGDARRVEKDEAGPTQQQTPVEQATTVKERYFTEAPDNFLIYVKRFQQTFEVDEKGAVVTKERKDASAVAFPMRLTLTEKQCPSDQAGYNLDACVIHSGETTNRGHYYSYIKLDGRWFEVNDTDTCPVTEAFVLTQIPQAYIVHYTKGA